MKLASLSCLLAGLLLHFGCAQKPADPKPEVERAIRDYLSTRPGLALQNMEVEVTEVTVEGETANATVAFRTKSGEGEMTMHYTLRRERERWVVERSSPHSGAGTLPPGHPPAGEVPAPPEKLPRTSR
jgi:hypothetical protein